MFGGEQHSHEFIGSLDHHIVARRHGVDLPVRLTTEPSGQLPEWRGGKFRRLHINAT